MKQTKWVITESNDTFAETDNVVHHLFDNGEYKGAFAYSDAVSYVIANGHPGDSYEEREPDGTPYFSGTVQNMVDSRSRDAEEGFVV